MSVSTHPTTLKQKAGQFEEGPSFANSEMSLDPNDWNQVFVNDIERGEGYLLGRGETRNPLQAEGFVGGHLMDNTATTAVQILGSYRITVRTRGSGRLVDVLDEGDLAEIDSRDNNNDKVDRKDRKPFPRTDDEFSTHEYQMVFEVKPESSTTVDTAPDSEQTELFVEGHLAERTA